MSSAKIAAVSGALQPSLRSAPATVTRSSAGGGESREREGALSRSPCSLAFSASGPHNFFPFCLQKLAPFSPPNTFPKTHFAMAFSLRAARLPTVRRSRSSRGTRKSAARCRGGGEGG